MARTVHVIRMRLVVEVVSQASLNGLVICEALRPERNGIRPALVMPNLAFRLDQSSIARSHAFGAGVGWSAGSSNRTNSTTSHGVSKSSSDLEYNPANWAGACRLPCDMLKGGIYARKPWSDTVRGSHWGGTLRFPWNLTPALIVLVWNFFHDVFGEMPHLLPGVSEIFQCSTKKG